GPGRGDPPAPHRRLPSPVRARGARRGAPAAGRVRPRRRPPRPAARLSRRAQSPGARHPRPALPRRTSPGRDFPAVGPHGRGPEEVSLHPARPPPRLHRPQDGDGDRMTPDERFEELWTAYLEGDLDAAGFDELQQSLAADPELL